MTWTFAPESGGQQFRTLKPGIMKLELDRTISIDALRLVQTCLVDEYAITIKLPDAVSMLQFKNEVDIVRARTIKQPNISVKELQEYLDQFKRNKTVVHKCRKFLPK